jgi:hypothetical protein
VVAAGERHDAHAARAVQRRPENATSTVVRDYLSALAINVPDHGRRGLPTTAP